MPRPTILTVTTTAQELLAANGRRKAYALTNRGTEIVYIGQDSTVAAATGATLRAEETLSAEDDSDAVWGIAAAGSQRVEALETLLS